MQKATDYFIEDSETGETIAMFGVSWANRDFCGFIDDISSASDFGGSVSSIAGADGGYVSNFSLGPRTVNLKVNLIEVDANVRARSVERIDRLANYRSTDRTLTIRWREATGIWKVIQNARLVDFPILSHATDGVVKSITLQFASPFPYVQSEFVHQHDDLEVDTVYEFPTLGNAPVFPFIKIFGPFTKATVREPGSATNAVVVQNVDIDTGVPLKIFCDPLVRSVVVGTQNYWGHVLLGSEDMLTLDSGRLTPLKVDVEGGSEDTKWSIEYRSNWVR